MKRVLQQKTLKLLLFQTCNYRSSDVSLRLGSKFKGLLFNVTLDQYSALENGSRLISRGRLAHVHAHSYNRYIPSLTCVKWFSSKNFKDDCTSKKSKSHNAAGKENIMTVPNLLTSLRIAVTPYLGYLVLQEDFTLACIVFTVAGISDVLDGYIARNFKNQMSALGTALDPLADKLLVSTLTVTLTMVNLFPVALTAVILGRDILLILSYLIIRYISLPPPKTLKRYLDVSYATVDMKPSNLSKMNTFLQISSVIASLLSPVYHFTNSPVLQALWCLTGCTTILSGLDYAFQRLKYVNYRQ